MPADRNSSRSGGASRGRSNSGSSRGGSSRPSSRGSSSGRPSAAKKSYSSRSASGRPASGRPSSGRPSSGRTVTGRDASDRRGPAKRSSSRPTTASSRSESGRPSSGRPSSGRPSSGRLSSGRPTNERTRSARPSSGRPSTDRPRSDRPRRDDERRPSTRSSDGRPKRYSEDKPKSATGNKRREWSSERPKASDDRRSSSSRPSSGRPTSGRPTSDRARTDRPSAGRPRRDGEERPRFDRKTSDRPRGGRADRAGGRFADRDERPARYVSEKRVNVNDPIIPDHITGEELPRAVRNELRTLPDGLALRVARHLAASGEMINVDPELAWQHARAALNKASRVGIVREAAAEAAYNAGHFAEALTEFRAARRMRGIKEYWPLMADCERALGRPAKAISMAADPLVNSLDRASKVEMRIVASGARVDQGKLEAALATLQCPELTTTSNEAWSARIRYAYADVLEKLGRKDEALEWFHRAAAADAAEQTDADERIAALEGVVYQDAAQFDDEDFDEED